MSNRSPYIPRKKYTERPSTSWQHQRQEMGPANTEARYMTQRSFSYSQVPSGWGSYDHFPVRHSVPLPPPLPSFHPPTRFLYYQDWPRLPPRSENRLRRWGNFYSLQHATGTSTPYSELGARSTREHKTRGDIGSLQQFPSAPFLAQAPRWHYSCRDLGPVTSLVCAFCKSNREPPEVYTSHQIRDKNGVVSCPILRKYRCRYCGATGDVAHTDSYCPKNPDRGMKSSMKTVLNTRMMSSGKMRSDSASSSKQ